MPRHHVGLGKSLATSQRLRRLNFFLDLRHLCSRCVLDVDWKSSRNPVHNNISLCICRNVNGNGVVE